MLVVGHRLVIKVCLSRASLVIVTCGRLHGGSGLVDADYSRKVQQIVVTRVVKIASDGGTIQCDTRKDINGRVR